MATFAEPTTSDKLFVYAVPTALSYGFDTKDKVLQELRARVKNLKGGKRLTWQNVRRPLYGLQYIGYAGGHVLRLAQMEATEVLKEYSSAQLPSGAILYVEEVGEEVYVFAVSGNANAGLAELRNLI
jgi:hypothetical protein